MDHTIQEGGIILGIFMMIYIIGGMQKKNEKATLVNKTIKVENLLTGLCFFCQFLQGILSS